MSKKYDHDLTTIYKSIIEKPFLNFIEKSTTKSLYVKVNKKLKLMPLLVNSLTSSASLLIRSIVFSSVLVSLDFLKFNFLDYPLFCLNFCFEKNEVMDPYEGLIEKLLVFLFSMDLL